MDIRQHLHDVGDAFVRLGEGREFVIEPQDVGVSFARRLHRAQYVERRGDKTFAIILQVSWYRDVPLADPSAVADFVNRHLVEVRDGEMAPEMFDYPDPLVPLGEL